MRFVGKTGRNYGARVLRRRFTSVRDWLAGRLEGWKAGRLEGWKENYAGRDIDCISKNHHYHVLFHIVCGFWKFSIADLSIQRYVSIVTGFQGNDKEAEIKQSSVPLFPSLQTYPLYAILCPVQSRRGNPAPGPRVPYRSDFLLIYKMDAGRTGIIIFVRAGTHSEFLF